MEKHQHRAQNKFQTLILKDNIQLLLAKVEKRRIKNTPGTASAWS